MQLKAPAKNDSMSCFMLRGFLKPIDLRPSLLSKIRGKNHIIINTYITTSYIRVHNNKKAGNSE